MKLSTHTHPRYIVWFKYLLLASIVFICLEFLYLDFVKRSNMDAVFSNVLSIFGFMLLYSFTILITAYFLGQNIAVVNEGLLIEFLGKDLFVPWDKVKEIKPPFGFFRSHRNPKKIYVVLTDALTPFHRLFGLLYGLSVKPAFIIFPSISEYDLLIRTIKKHVGKA
ncbi:MAG: hypothetical protein QM730_10085 [Anaerolineales bacterium]